MLLIYEAAIFSMFCLLRGEIFQYISGRYDLYDIVFALRHQQEAFDKKKFKVYDIISG